MTSAPTSHSVFGRLVLALFAAAVLASASLVPAPAHAAALTEPQIAAVVGLLQAYGVDQTALASISAILRTQISSATPAAVPTSTFSITASPSSGTAPLAVKFALQGSFSGYTVDFGDGTDGGGAISDADCSVAGRCSISHTYSAAGTYTAQLKVSGKVVATASVTVSSVFSSLTASPSSGAAPLATKFSIRGAFSSYSIEFGDGQSAGGAISDGDCSVAGHCSASHTYSAAGTYTATLKAGGKAVATAVVSVSSPVATAFTASPASGSAPLAVKFSIKGSFTSYEVAFGDSQSGGGASSDGSCAAGCSSTHTYSAAGTYTAQLKVDGKVVATATIAPSAPSSVSDAQRKAELQEIAAGLTAYYGANGTYIVVGGGSNGGGRGWVAYEDTGAYKKAVTRVLYEKGFMSRLILQTPYNYTLYTCKTASGLDEFALAAKLDNPSAADIENIKASCNGTGANGTYDKYGRNYAVSGIATPASPSGTPVSRVPGPELSFSSLMPLTDQVASAAAAPYSILVGVFTDLFVAMGV